MVEREDHLYCTPTAITGNMKLKDVKTSEHRKFGSYLSQFDALHLAKHQLDSLTVFSFLTVIIACRITSRCTASWPLRHAVLPDNYKTNITKTKHFRR